MAERKISGIDELVSFDLAGGTSYDLVVCLTSHSFGIENAIIDAKSFCGADQLPGVQSFNVDFSGQVVLSPATDRVGMYLLLNAAKNKTTIGWKRSKATPATGDIVIAGTGFIASIKQDNTVDGPATFTATLGVFGTPTITETP